jgi:hypothetical protein
MFDTEYESTPFMAYIVTSRLGHVAVLPSRLVDRVNFCEFTDTREVHPLRESQEPSSARRNCASCKESPEVVLSKTRRS